MRTAADGAVIDDLTRGVVTAHSGARVYAFAVDAGLLSGAICADYAFRTAAVSERIAEVSRRTFANGTVVDGFANGIRAAG